MFVFAHFATFDATAPRPAPLLPHPAGKENTDAMPVGASHPYPFSSRASSPTAMPGPDALLLHLLRFAHSRQIAAVEAALVGCRATRIVDLIRD